jgi:hypothetical protein
MKTINSRLKGLERAIFIHNEYYRVAGPILEHVKTECKKFIGKKIQLQKGLSQKLYDATKIDRDSIKVNPLPGTKWASLHYAGISCSYKDLSVEISLCFSDGTTGCTYEKRSFYFGKVDDSGVLISIDDNCKAESEPMNFEAELKAIADYLKAAKVAEQLEDKIRLSRDAYKYVSIEDITGKKE